MKYLQKKRTIAYTLIVFILFVGMCLGYFTADSVSVCARSKSSVASIRSISGLSRSREVCVQEKSRLTRQPARSSSRRNGIAPELVGHSEIITSNLLGNIHFHSTTTVSESFEGNFSEEDIVRYLHRTDGEKDDPDNI